MTKRAPKSTSETFRLHPLVLALHSATLALWAGNAAGLPVGGRVASGQSSISTPSAQNMVIRQGTDKSVINWQSYNIAAPEHVRYQQPSASSISLNRVQGAEPSGIYGKLSANGQVFLVNPNGVVFGKTARVETGGLVASTHDISDQDFQAGRYTFSKGASHKAAAVVNEGELKSKPGGYVALIGTQVTNTGHIHTPQGTTALAAGERVNLDLRGDGLMNVEVDLAAAKAKIDHKSIIEAPGGKVYLTAQAKDAALDTVLNVEGVVRATSIAQRNGVIHLDGGDSGLTRVAGRLEATGGQAGEKGGSVKVLGRHVELTETAHIDVSGEAGGGTALVGGDYQGRAGTRTAETTTVKRGARLHANARTQGDGGQVVVWADKSTRFDGDISARGGNAGGNGGQAEVSGLENLSITGYADLSAPHGDFGTLLLDPGSVTIQDGTGTNTGPNSFDDLFLINQLNKASVTVATSAATNGAAETINVLGNSNITWGKTTTLTLQAGRNITVNSGAVIQNTTGGTKAFNAIVLNANQGATPVAGNFQGIAVNGARLQTSRGNITLTGRGGTTGSFNIGILLTGNSIVRTATGAINLTGTAGGDGTGTLNTGISVETSDLVEATGAGTVTITGTGGNGTTDNNGINFLAGSPIIRTTSGKLSLTGNGGSGVSSRGLYSQTTVTLGSTRGAIQITGKAGSANDDGIFFNGGATAIGGAKTTGTITLTGDRINLNAATVRTTGTAVLQGQTAGRAIDLGGADSATQMGLSSAEINKVTAGSLQIGNATAGNISFSSAIAPTGTTKLSLITGGDVSQAAGATITETNLAVNAGGSITLGEANDVTTLASKATGAVSFTDKNALTIGTVAGVTGVTAGGTALIQAPNGLLTVNAKVTAGGNGDALTLVAQRFTNGAGASALSAPSGRWRVFSQNPANDKRGGLAFNFKRYNCNFGGACPPGIPATGNGFLYSIAPVLSVTPNSATGIYGNAPNLAGLGFGLSGFIDGDTQATSGISGTASFSTPATAASKVGKYDIAYVIGLASDLGYGFKDNTASVGEYSISARPLILTPDAVSRIYGDANPPSGTATANVGGLVNGDTVASVTLNTPATPASKVGSYATTGADAIFGAGLASNYAITYATNPTGLTITPATLTYLADPASRLYGDPNPAFTGTVTGFKLTDTQATATTGTLAFTSPATAASNVGSYAIDGSGLTANNGNYLFVQAPGNATALSINQRPVTVTANPGQGRLYGDPDPSAFTFTTTSLGAGAPLNGALTRTAGDNVGAYAIGQNTLTNANNPNYVLTYIGDNFTIRQRPVTVTVDGGQGKVYGNADPAAFTYSFTSLGNGVPLVGTLTRVSGENVGNYAIQPGSLDGANNPNYALTYIGNNFGISRRPVTITVTPGQGKRFGQPDPVFDFAFTDLGSGEPLVGSLSRAPGEAIGAYPIEPGTLNAANNPNYRFSFIGDLFNIQPLLQPAAQEVAGLLTNTNFPDRGKRRLSAQLVWVIAIEGGGIRLPSGE